MYERAIELFCDLPVLPVPGQSAGLVVSKGVGRHSRRRIPVYDLLFVRDGVLSMQEEAQTFEVNAGEALLLWPNRLHGGTKDYPKDLRYFWMEFTIPHRGTTEAVSPLTNETAGSMQIQQHTRVSNPAFLTELFLLYTNLLESRRDVPLQGSLMANLILTVVSAPPSVEDAASNSVYIVAGRANAYIRTNYRKAITPAQVAAAIDCNYQHLSRIFRRVYHQTLTQAIREARIGYALHLLTETNLNITQIAAACGFTDYRYFYRIFQADQGMTATEFRSLHARAFINTE